MASLFSLVGEISRLSYKMSMLAIFSASRYLQTNAHRAFLDTFKIFRQISRKALMENHTRVFKN